MFAQKWQHRIAAMALSMDSHLAVARTQVEFCVYSQSHAHTCLGEQAISLISGQA
jgi:hypothetical protein